MLKTKLCFRSRRAEKGQERTINGKKGLNMLFFDKKNLDLLGQHPPWGPLEEKKKGEKGVAEGFT